MIEFNTHFLFVTVTKHGEEELEFSHRGHHERGSKRLSRDNRN